MFHGLRSELLQFLLQQLYLLLEQVLVAGRDRRVRKRLLLLMRAAAVLNDGVALALVGKIDHATTVAEGGKGPIILGLEGGRDGLGLYH